MKNLLPIIMCTVLLTSLLTSCEKKDEVKPSTSNQRVQQTTSTSSPINIKAKGVSSIIQGQQVDVFNGSVTSGDVILLTWHTLIAGQPGVLYVESITNNSHFTIESSEINTGWVSWVVIAN